MTPHALKLSPISPPPDGGGGLPPHGGEASSDGEDLPYRVEVWNEAGDFVEMVVAVSLSPAIGYAAYYAATREYPRRSITLRHKARIISRWSGQAH